MEFIKEKNTTCPALFKRIITDDNKTQYIIKKVKSPIFIIKNGYGDLVIMSMEAYERKLALADIYQKLAEAKADIANGSPLLDGEEVLKSFLPRPHGGGGGK